MTQTQPLTKALILAITAPDDDRAHHAARLAESIAQGLNVDQVDAQQARRFLDRVVGFMVSPLLWKKVARGLSAGRVQSVAVRLVVEREREIKAFVPEEYWSIDADTMTASKHALQLAVSKYQGKTFSAVNKAQADQALSLLN